MPRTQAADQGNAHSQYNLGLMYLHGRGVAKDDERAGKLFTQAADQGQARAQCNLGFIYEHGRGVAKDEERAVRLVAASLPHPML